MNTAHKTAAQIAWRQISVHTLMACGAREPVQVNEDTLRFKVESKPMRYVRVVYCPGLDAYTVEYYRLKRSDYSEVSLARYTEVYAENLSEVIYGAVNR